MTPKEKPSHAAKGKFQFEAEDPLCVLKVELDGGQNVQHVKVYEG